MIHLLKFKFNKIVTQPLNISSYIIALFLIVFDLTVHKFPHIISTKCVWLLNDFYHFSSTSSPCSFISGASLAPGMLIAKFNHSYTQ
jgi:hypothetical protein